MNTKRIYGRLNAEQKEYALEKYNSGSKPKDIALALGVDRNIIYSLIDRSKRGSVVHKVQDPVDFEIHIDEYARVITNFSNGRAYSIKYKDNDVEKEVVIDRESTIGLARLGYLVGYQVNSSYISNEYLSTMKYSGQHRIAPVCEKLDSNIEIKHITNLRSLQDKRIYKTNIKKLIFGDNNVLSGVVIEFNGTSKFLDIAEYCKLAENRYYSASYDDYIKIFKNEITLDYKKEYDNFLRSTSCRARTRHIIDLKVVYLPISRYLNYITAKTFLTGRDIELCVKYSRNQKQTDEFIDSLKYYKSSLELGCNDDIRVTKLYIGNNGYNSGFFELVAGNEKILTDATFSCTSSIYRNILSQNKANYKTVNIGLPLKCIKTARKYNKESHKTEFTMEVDYEALESMRIISLV